jgi:hypothetical protein
VQDPPLLNMNEPPIATPEMTMIPYIDAKALGAEKKVTTEKLKWFKVPDSVHICILLEKLKNYVGLPIYHKDRMYVCPPPIGVSTGLGYLGNGSSAIMPTKATVSSLLLYNMNIIDGILCVCVDNARQGWSVADWQTWQSDLTECTNHADLDEITCTCTWHDARHIDDDSE